MSSRNSFGRLAAPKDARDLSYLMRTAMPQLAKPTPRTRPYHDGPLLDQGATPRCVGFAARGLLDGAPIMTKPEVGPSAGDLYNGAQLNDEWPGNDYDGTSVRGVMKYMQKLGAIAGYAWGQTLDVAIKWMNDGYGTIEVGTNWYAEMSYVDHDGFMVAPPSNMSTPIGGHAYRWIWFDKKRNGILMRNSWGHDFGYIDPKTGLPSGYAYMSLTLAQRLLDEDGEIAAPTQVKIKPVLP